MIAEHPTVREGIPGLADRIRICIVFLSTAVRSDIGRSSGMATYVLVHGGSMSAETWNKLSTGDPVSTKDGWMGGRIWDGTVSVLTAQNHRVFAPTLRDEYTCHLTDHIRQVGALITENDLRNVILVGHSYGGMVIAGVAAGMPHRIRRIAVEDNA